MTKLHTFGTTFLRALDLLEAYKAIDSVATGKIPSLFCAESVRRHCQGHRCKTANQDIAINNCFVD